MIVVKRPQASPVFRSSSRAGTGQSGAFQGITRPRVMEVPQLVSCPEGKLNQNGGEEERGDKIKRIHAGKEMG